MKHLQKILFSIAMIAMIAMIASCAPVMQPPMKALDSGSAKTAGGKYVPKVANFQVILDASLSMDEGGKNDFLVARHLVSRINRGIPTDLSYNGGLRSIGHNSSQSMSPTDLLYGMTSYKQAGFHAGLGKIKYIGGVTPMAEALTAAGADLQATGNSALIIVSDGLDMAAAPAAALKIKGMLGDKLCIYTIAVGNERNGSGLDMLQKIADAGGCGFATTDAALASDAKMAAFIDDVFLTTPKAMPKPAPIVVAPKDSDGDGVTDDKDQCPSTPRGAPVNSVGCPLDSDGDGVYDYRDNCPNTPKGVSVDSKGCPTKLTLRINFRPDSNVIGEQYLAEIAKAAKCVNEFPGNVVFIDGHTDSQGAADYNQGLSERRAGAVVEALIDKFDIPAPRLTARGFGESQPIADNKTKEGRFENRRVEVACGAVE